MNSTSQHPQQDVSEVVAFWVGGVEGVVWRSPCLSQHRDASPSIPCRSLRQDHCRGQAILVGGRCRCIQEEGRLQGTNNQSTTGSVACPPGFPAQSTHPPHQHRACPPAAWARMCRSVTWRPSSCTSSAGHLAPPAAKERGGTGVDALWVGQVRGSVQRHAASLMPRNEGRLRAMLHPFACCRSTPCLCC